MNAVYRFHRKRKDDVRQTSCCKPNTSKVADEIAKIESQRKRNDMGKKRPHVLKKSGLIKCWKLWMMDTEQ